MQTNGILAYSPFETRSGYFLGMGNSLLNKLGLYLKANSKNLLRRPYELLSIVPNYPITRFK